MKLPYRIALFFALATAGGGLGQAGPLTADWPRFRGPDGFATSEGAKLPLQWSDTQNVVWKAALPGAGASSPIVVGDRIFLTLSTGGASAVQRHVLCIERATGKTLWDTIVPSELPEQDPIRENHGYASSTPVADAERVYVFFGKSGVSALDHAGKLLWNAKVGDRLHGWGSGTSPVLHGNLLLVNASVESEALVALDKSTGKEVWRAGGVKDSWHAPVLVTAPSGANEVVVAIYKQVLGFDAKTGESLWRCDTGINWYMCPTPVARDGIVYAIGGRNPNGGLAIKAGGRGDVTGSHVVWKLNKGSNVSSPVLHQGHLYFAHENIGIVYCVNAKTGDVVYEERLAPSPGQIYASPVLADGRLYYFGRGGRAAVVAAKPQFELRADNTLEGGRGVFNASPAITGHRLLVRSERFLYCLGEK